MRNLKRVLSLVLALVMAMSLMVVGTSAAFKDEADFSAEYVTAAEVLTNLNVLWGYEDGSFQPKGDITRAEVAALIYRAVTGDVTDAQKDVYSAMTNDFSDVKDGQWFAGYVNFCANAKFVAGYGDGTFGPNDKVTGYQTLAMILRAIGYDHNGEFIGADWEIRTAAIAQDIGLLDNVKSEQLGQPASRELVAELIFQAMNAPMVKWVSIYEGYRPLDKDGTTLGQKTFKLNEVEGVVLANEYANLGADSLNALKAGKTNIGGTEYNLTTDTSVIGEKVSVWVADKDAVSTPISKAKVADWSNLAEAELTKDQVKDWDKNSKGAEIYYNYDKAPAFDLFDKGITVKAIDNDGDGDYEYVLAEKQTLAKIKTIATDGVITLNNVKSVGDQVVYSNAKVGDVVLVISYDGATYIEKADSITGIVSGYDTRGDIETATIGGESYAVSGIVFGVKAGDAVKQFNTVRDTYQPGADWNGKYYAYYQDAYGNIIAYEEAGENATEYGLILDYDVYKSGAFQGDLTWRPLDGINFGDLYVKYLTVDNKVETAKVDVDGKYFTAENTKLLSQDKYVDTTAINAGDVVSYNINSDGEFTVVYTYDCKDPAVSVVTDADKGLARVGDQPELYNVNDDLVVFYYITAGSQIGQFAFDDVEIPDELDNYIGEALGTILPVTPIYGVLTGDEAIADLEWGKDAHQMDVTEAPASSHTNKYDGDADMFNIRGIMNPFVDYCYIRNVDKYKAEQINDEYFHTYNAIDSQGNPIEVTTKQILNPEAGHVYAYLTLDVNGETVNLLVKVPGCMLREGDIHQGNGGIEVYEETDQKGTLYDAPEVYADVSTDKGGTTSVSKDYCTTGVVVLEAGETAAVFVTDTCDNEIDYVDCTINGEKKHIKIGTELKDVCVTVTPKEGASWVKHNPVKVEADWDGATIVTKATTACEVCVPHNDIREAVITQIGQPSKNIVCLQNLTGYASKEAALANPVAIDLKGATWLHIATANDKLDASYAIYTSSAAAKDGDDTQFSAPGADIDCSTLTSNGVLLIKVVANDGTGVSLKCAHNHTAEAVYVAIQLPTL